MLDFHKIELDVLEFWSKNQIYQKLKKRNAKGKPFYFLQGPPYTSGKLHIGQAWNEGLKDMALRYKRMQGFDVWDRGGYDMHGLPTENAVQKKLGFKSKDEIEKHGVDKFIKECIDFSNEHAEYMSEDLWKLGVWLDHKNAYKPLTKSFISGQWAFFKKAHKQGRLYKGLKTMHWDAQSETALAKHELEYRKVKDETVFLKFKKKNTKNEYFLIWTTTPWTIPFNLAIMANPEVDYVKIKVDGEFWIMAKALVSVFLTPLNKKFKIVEEFKGAKLEGQEYEHFLNKDMDNVYDKLKKKHPKVHSIILSKDYVDTSSGTGLVHCAPGCGPEDFEVGQENNLPPLNTLSERGEFENSGKYTGWIAKKDDKKFIEDFKKKGVLLTTTIVEHEYPMSWRSHEPVIFRTTEQWFLKIKDIVQKMLEMDKKVYWFPEKTRTNYLKWTENLKDNSITRQRYWGCPVPIWVNTENPNDYIVIGSSEELEKLSGKKFDDLSIHRPWIDEVEIKKPGGKVYKRIPDVSDVWIDSGTTSWNCLYNDPKLIKKYFPADFILEATEQTRLWYSMLQVCSAIMFGKTSYKNVYSHGMMLDYQGTKMSKSLGNIISPYEVTDKYSADILRYYMGGQTAGENINFNWEGVKVKQRNLIIFQNTANYILDLERQKIKKGSPGIEETWIISKYNSTLKQVTGLFEQYRLDETIVAIEDLFITLSRDYIKFVRDKASDNSAVSETLKETYVGILKMFSTICPFITENLWQEMSQKEESVHLAKWPQYDPKKIDKKLEEDFTLAMVQIEKGLAERDKNQIGLRWPLAKATISYYKKFDKKIEKIIAKQLNVKKVEWKKEHEGGWKVELDTKMTPELESEGFAREIARKVQSERKKAGLKKGDLITLSLSLPKDLESSLQPWLNFLKERTNSKAIEFTKEKGASDFVIKGKKIGIKFSSA